MENSAPSNVKPLNTCWDNYLICLQRNLRARHLFFISLLFNFVIFSYQKDKRIYYYLILHLINCTIPVVNLTVWDLKIALFVPWLQHLPRQNFYPNPHQLIRSRGLSVPDRVILNYHENQKLDK